MAIVTGRKLKSWNLAAILAAVAALGVAIGFVSRKVPAPAESLEIPLRRRTGWLRTLGWLALAYAGLAVVAAVFATIYIATGAYNVAATSQHYGWTFRLIHFVATRSIDVRAAKLKPPSLGPEDIDRGLVVFDQACARCHGAPGQAREAFAEGMNPLPPPLAQPGRTWTMQQIYWTTAHGVHMTGMPAFMFRMPEADLWAVAAWVKEMPYLTPEQYEARRKQAKAKTYPEPAPPPLLGEPDPKRGKLALAQHGCVGCHVIPGLSASQESQIGPALAGVGRRAFIAGTLANNSANLAAFIAHPKSVRPKGAMPDMRVNARDAADMVAYLRSLRNP